MAKSSGGSKKKDDAKNAGKDAGKDAKKTTSSRGKKKDASKKESAPSKRDSGPKKTGPQKAKKVNKPAGDAGEEGKPEKRKPKKSPVLKCQFCEKTMRDQKTLRIHERNCQTRKDGESERRLEDAILVIKNDFKEERQDLIDQFQRREDALQRELNELRTVMRMEIDKHRRELDMIRKVEREVHKAVENQEVSRLPSSPEPKAVMEASQPKDAPRAIDMIPTPLPSLPRKNIGPVPVEEEPGPIPEKEPVQEAPGPVEEPVTEKSSVSGMGASAVSESASVDAGTSITREAVEAIVRSMVQDMAVETSQLPAGELPQLEDIKRDFNQIRRRMDALDSKIEGFGNDMKRTLDKDSDIKRLERDMARVSDRILDMMEDIGFEEDLSVTKIPPTILEIVYQATLDDILREIVRSKGAQDAERIASQSLEEVRLKTSGSELFKFDGRKIVTDNLARSIEANRISAKQIQTTYNVLLDRLLETVPHHKAKNFRGMIKVKSQEFAVDRATVLTKEFNRMEKVLESTSQMVAALSAQSNARSLEFNEMFDEIRNKLLAEKAGQDELELLKTKMQERDERIAALDSELALLKAELEMKERIKDHDREEPAIIVPGETINPTEIVEDAAPAEPEPVRDITAEVLGAILDGASSKTAIIRETDLSEEEVLNAVSILVGEKKVAEKKMGRRIKYMTPEQELDEKLRSAEIKTPKKGKKADAGKDVRAKSSSGDKTVKKASLKMAKKEDSAETGGRSEKKKPTPGEKAVKKESPKTPREPVKEKSSGTPKEPAGRKKAKKAEDREEPVSKKEKKVPASATDESKRKKPAAKKKQKTPASGKTGQPESAAEKDAGPESKQEKEPAAKEKHPGDELPVITKKLEDLSVEELRVLDVISEEGMTISGIQSRVGKDMKRFALLRSLRVLIDSGHVGILSKGRMELYQRINVKKVDKKNKNKQEVKS